MFGPAQNILGPVRHLYTVKLGISELPDSEHLGFYELF